MKHWPDTPIFSDTASRWDLAERTWGLKKLGATEVIGALSTDSKALDEERWGGAIDLVGGWEPPGGKLCTDWYDLDAEALEKLGNRGLGQLALQFAIKE